MPCSSHARQGTALRCRFSQAPAVERRWNGKTRSWAGWLAVSGAVAHPRSRARAVRPSPWEECRRAGPCASSSVSHSGTVPSTDQCSGPRPPVAASATEIRAAGDRLRQAASVSRSRAGLARPPRPRAGLFSARSESTALGRRAMITIVRSKMKSNAPVSLVTTTATNESSPELPNSELEPPPRRDRRIQTPPSHGLRGPFQRFSRASCPPTSSVRAHATRIESGRCGPASVRSSKSFLTMFRYRALPCSMLTFNSSRASLRLVRLRAHCSCVARLDRS